MHSKLCGLGCLRNGRLRSKRAGLRLKQLLPGPCQWFKDPNFSECARGSLSHRWLLRLFRARLGRALSLAGVAERSALGRLRPLRYRKSCEAVVSQGSNQGSGSSCDRHRQHLFKERTKAEILRLSACVPSRCPARAAPGGAGSLSELLSVSVDANITL